MRITRNMLETCISAINSTSGLTLSVKTFNGRTHLYYSDRLIEEGTASECLNALSIFMSGVQIGMWLVANSEVK